MSALLVLPLRRITSPSVVKQRQLASSLVYRSLTSFVDYQHPFRNVWPKQQSSNRCLLSIETINHHRIFSTTPFIQISENDGTTSLNTNAVQLSANITDQKSHVVHSSIPWLDSILVNFVVDEQQHQQRQLQEGHDSTEQSPTTKVTTVDWKRRLLPRVLSAWRREFAMSNEAPPITTSPHDVVNDLRRALSSLHHIHKQDEDFDILLEMLLLSAPPPPMDDRISKRLNHIGRQVEPITKVMDSILSKLCRPPSSPGPADSPDAPTNGSVWNAVLRAWCRTRRIDAADRMMHLYAAHANSSPWWDDSSWYWLLTTLADSDHPDYGPTRAEDMLAVATASHGTLQPAGHRTLVLGWTRLFQEQPEVAPERARVLLQQLITAARELDPNQEHDHSLDMDRDDNDNNKTEGSAPKMTLRQDYIRSILSCYSAMVKAYVESRQGKKAAQLLLEQCRDAIEQLKTTSPQPPVISWPSKKSFHDVMISLSKLRSLPGWRTQTVLEKMESACDVVKQHSSLDPDIHNSFLRAQPTTLHYNVALDAWANGQQPKEAELLLWKMVNALPSKRHDGEPDTATNEKSRTEGSESDAITDTTNDIFPHSVTQITSHTIRPDAISLTAVLKAWLMSSRRDAAIRAQALWDKLTQPPERAIIEPTALSYSTLMTIWSNSKRTDAGVRTQRLFDDWAAHYRLSKGNPALRPHPEAYTTLLAAWASCGYGDEAERIIALMDNHQIPVDIRCFHAVMNAWFRSGLMESPDRAQRVVTEVERRYAAGDDRCKPDILLNAKLIEVWGRSGRYEAVAQSKAIFSHLLDNYHPDSPQQEREELRPLYNALLFSIRRLGSVDEAEKLLLEMCNGRERTNPDITSFNHVLAGWARSPLTGAPERAEQILRKLQSHSASRQNPGDANHRKPFVVRPDTMSYNLVMKAWAQHKNISREGAFKKVDELFQELKAHNQAHAGSLSLIIPMNATTYKHYLEAMIRANLPNLEERVNQVLQEMKRQGLNPNRHIVSLLERHRWRYAKNATADEDDEDDLFS